MPQPTKPQLALYAAFAIAVLVIGSRFLRESGDGTGGAAPPALDMGAGSPDGASGAGGAPAGGGVAAGGADPLAGGGAVDGGAAAGGDAAALAGEGALVVDVKGAVRRPGVYRLAAGARAIDAVRRAGGMTGRADRLGVNLAARLSDGGEVVVPRRGQGGALGVGGVPSSGGGAPGGASGSGAGDPAGPLQIDINTASAQELEQLDGVGPATAAKIIAYRELHGGFRSIEELDEVSGIGEAKLAAIRTQLGR
ncbi:helix-hairpin-helix domain-containing protein [Conexibacter arvalis]|uniref:Competence protein ComEA n=1 Tax=Conexibacter arvalis TaxID=912552 RepID=A0A840IIA7_9ACTN|nr:competence protein ComEA [Conexibacter arvalis]